MGPDDTGRSPGMNGLNMQFKTAHKMWFMSLVWGLSLLSFRYCDALENNIVFDAWVLSNIFQIFLNIKKDITNNLF